jgi:Uma2 family endonuclease
MFDTAAKNAPGSMVDMFVSAPSRHVFDVDEWDRLGLLGFFGEDDRVQLIDGEIIDMSPMGTRHAACVNRLNMLLARQVGDDAIVQIQCPVRLSRRSEPEPDVAVLRSRADFYSGAKPGPSDVLLVVEVADTSLGFDLGAKASLYSAASLAEYWVVDLAAEAVHVLTDPGPDGYASRVTVGQGGTLAPLLLPLQVAVSSVLGDKPGTEDIPG